jgi:Rieske Fe-S protein
MKKSAILSRRLFFKAIAGLGSGFCLWLWHRMGQIRERSDHPKEVRHGAEIPVGLSYFGKYYLFRKGDAVRAFSTGCTHAGCRLGKEYSGFLQCGCHGSRFNAETGFPVRGPAILPLKEFECQFEADTNQWVIKFSG